MLVCWPLTPESSWHGCAHCRHQEIEIQPRETNVQEALGSGQRGWTQDQLMLAFAKRPSPHLLLLLSWKGHNSVPQVLAEEQQPPECLRENWEGVL